MSKSKSVRPGRNTPLTSRLTFNKTISLLVAIGLVGAGYIIATGHAANNAIVGPDTSNHQTYLNAGPAFDQGYRFQIMKATEGLSFQDFRFETSLANAKAAHLIPGAYHFLHRGDGAAQADYFINFVKSHNGGKTGGVAYMVDVETYGTGNKYPVYSDVTDFVARFKQLVPGRTLILYTGEWFWGSQNQAGYLHNPKAPSGTVLDVSLYVSCTGTAWSILNNCVTPQGAAGEPYAANPINGYSSYFFRQYSDQATFANLTADANVTYKGMTSLKDLAGIDTPTPKPTPKPSPSPTHTPTPTPKPTPSPTHSPTPSPTNTPTPSPSPTNSPAPTPLPTPASQPKIKSGIGNKCLDNYKNSTANGNKVDIYSCNGTWAQRWEVSGKYVKLNGKCLNVAGSGTANGTKVILWDCSTAANNQWTYSNNTLKSVSSGKCLDDPKSSTADGTQLQIYTCNGTNAQKWTATTYTPASVGDINGDGRVTVLDLSSLLSHWGTNDAASDLNKDGTVDIFDLSILLGHSTG